MSLIIPANSASAAGGYEVANSLRLGGSNESLSFSESTTPTGLTKFTLSTWVKRSKLGSDQVIMFNAKDGSNFAQIYFRGSQKDIRYFDRVGGGDTCVGTTDMLFNDVGAFYHIVLRVDTTLGTAGDRVRIYVNGNEVAFTFDNTPSQNQALTLNNTGTKYIGVDSSGGNYFGGYHSEFCWIDGSSLAPDQFGEFDEDSGIWKPIDVSGLTFGNNGFYLNFETAAELGTDVSGNSNTFTESNLTAIDQSTDTCTNNFATINSLDSFYEASTFSEGNLKIITESSLYSYNTSTIGLTQGKWYCEVYIEQTAAGTKDTVIGIAGRMSEGNDGYLGKYNDTYGLFGGNGNIFVGENQNTTYGSSQTTGDIVGIHMDLDNNKLYFAKNGTVMNSTGYSIPVNVSATTAGAYFMVAADFNGGTTATYRMNFGNPIYALSSANTDVNGYGSFEYDPSAGTFDGASKDFLAICTKNLAEYG